MNQQLQKKCPCAEQLNYPENTPPENVLMAIEYYYSQENQENKMPERTCWKYINGEWWSMSGSFMPYRVRSEDKIIRFKPW